MFNYLLWKWKDQKIKSLLNEFEVFFKKKSIIYFGWILNQKNFRSRKWLWKECIEKECETKQGEVEKNVVRGVERVEPRNERIHDVPRRQQPTRRVAVDVLATLSFTVRSLSLSVSRNQKAQTSTNKGAPPPCPCLEIETRGATISSPVPSSFLSFLPYFAS